MPQRRRLVKVETPELQGDDSWVMIRKVSGHDGIKLMQLRQRITGADPSDDSVVIEMVQETCNVMLEHLVDWNWVDDDGNPLPKPIEIDDLMDLLTYEEIAGLSTAMRAIRTGAEPQGN